MACVPASCHSVPVTDISNRSLFSFLLSPDTISETISNHPWPTENIIQNTYFNQAQEKRDQTFFPLPNSMHFSIRRIIIPGSSGEVTNYLFRYGVCIFHPRGRKKRKYSY